MRIWLIASSVALTVACAVLAVVAYRATRPPPGLERALRARGERNDPPVRERSDPSVAEPRPPVVVLTGTVTRAGAPAAARVIACFRSGVTGVEEPFAAFLRPLSTEPTYEVAAGDDGRFVFEDLPPGRYRLEARAADGARGSAVGRVGGIGTGGPAEIELRRGEATLRGRSRHADGRPFIGEVLLTGGHWGRSVYAAPGTLPGASGNFRFDGLEPGEYRLGALLPGPRRLLGRVIRLPREEPVDFVIDEGIASVAGVVVSAGDGSPVPGATVLVMGGAPTMSIARTTSAANGSFSVPAPRGLLELHVAADGFRTLLDRLDLPEEPLTIRLSPGNTGPRDSAPSPGAPAGVRVTVVDAEGRPVSGAVVRVLPDGSSVGRSTAAPSDDDGIARFTGLDPDVPHEITVEPPGDRLDLLATVVADWIPGDVVVPFDRGFVIRGSVRRPDGEPFPKARLSHRRGRVLRYLDLDEAGRFVIGNLAPGPHVFCARDPDSCGVENEEVVVEASTGTVDLVVDPGLAVVVRIEGLGAHPLVPAAVVIEGRGETLRRPIRRGEIRLSGLRSEERLAVFVGPVDGDRCLLLRGLHPGAGIVEAQLAEGQMILGRVLAAEGSKTIVAWVTVLGRKLRARVGSNGAFVIRGVPAGRWPLSVRVDGGPSRIERETQVEPWVPVEIDARE